MKKNKIDLLKILASLWQPIAPLFNLCITSVILAMGFLRADLSAEPQKNVSSYVAIANTSKSIWGLLILMLEFQFYHFQ